MFTVPHYNRRIGISYGSPFGRYPPSPSDLLFFFLSHRSLLFFTPKRTLCLPLYLHLPLRTFISKPSWPPLVPSSGASLKPSTQSCLLSSLFSDQWAQASAGTSMEVSLNIYSTCTRFSSSGRPKNRYVSAASSTLHTPIPMSTSPSSTPPPAATPSAPTWAMRPRSSYICFVSSRGSPSSTMISSSGIVTMSWWSTSRLRRFR